MKIEGVSIQDVYDGLLFDLETAEFTVIEYDNGNILNAFNITKTKERIKEMKQEILEIEEKYPEVMI